MRHLLKILSTAAWCALVFGLVCAVLRLCIDVIAPPTFPLAVQGVSLEILWIAPLLNVPIFLAIGLAMAFLFRLVRLPEELIGSTVLFFIMFLGLLLVPSQLSRAAAVSLALGLTAMAVRWSASRNWPLFSAARTLPHVTALVLLLFAGTLAGRGISEWQAERSLPTVAGQPNVLLVVVDTLRADRTSAYGYPRKTTPGFETIASEGAIFSQAISSSSWTLPSHLALMSGISPDEKETLHRPLNPKHIMLAEQLRAHGYRTGGFVANNGFGNRNMGLAQGFIHYEDFFHSLEDAFNRTTFGSRILSRFYARFRPYDYPGRRKGADLIRDFWKWQDGGADPQRPFFAFLNFMEVHHPYYLPEDPAHGSVSKLVGFQHRAPLNQDAYGRNVATASAERWESESYDVALKHVDRLISMIENGLRERGLTENTLLIITSDHGEALFEHQLFGHGKALYRETVHVPLVMRWPGHISPGTDEARPVSSSDVPGLILDLLRLRGNFPGRSLLPLGQAASPNDSAASFLEQNPWGRPEWPNHNGWIKSVVTSKWHFILYQDGRTQLFDWAADPQEEHDLSATTLGQTTISGLRPALPSPENSKLASTPTSARRGAD